MRDYARRLLRRVSGVCGHRPNLVAVAREEDEAAAGTEPRGVEMPSKPVMTLPVTVAGAPRLSSNAGIHNDDLIIIFVWF